MTHPSGIGACSQLIDEIKLVKQENYRCIQIKVENEELIMLKKFEAVGSFTDDYDNCVSNCLNPNECTYIFVRTDEPNSMGYNWLFLHWVPDNATVREKMLYASTKSTVKKQFGEAYITDDLMGYDKDDLLLVGYNKHIDSKSAPPPLSMAELELNEIKRMERETALGDGFRTLKCMVFPPTEPLIKEIENFASEEIDFIEMAIVIGDEKIESKGTKKSVDIDSIRNLINPDVPRYFLWRYRHTFDSESFKSILFVYHMPGYQASVKERMLYSSCKGPFIEVLQSHFGIKLDKKLELIGGDMSDIQAENLLLELHPPKLDARPSISKPKGPSNRGPKRLI